MSHTLGEKVIHTRVGEPVEVKVAGTGTTGYLWRVNADPSKVRVVSHRNEPDPESFGGAGEEAFVLEAVEEGGAPVTFSLETPWDQKPAEVHTVMLDSRVGSGD
jgi:predicted secreted protein